MRLIRRSTKPAEAVGDVHLRPGFRSRRTVSDATATLLPRIAPLLPRLSCRGSSDADVSTESAGVAWSPPAVRRVEGLRLVRSAASVICVTDSKGACRTPAWWRDSASRHGSPGDGPNLARPSTILLCVPFASGEARPLTGVLPPLDACRRQLRATRPSGRAQPAAGGADHRRAVESSGRQDGPTAWLSRPV
jgi:hypothetical protein